MDCSPPDSSVHGDCPGKNTGAGFHALHQGNLPNPGIEPRSPSLQADSLPVEPQGKPKNPGGSSLSLLQRIFPTQELNQGLLHCKQILYQLSYQGSPSRSNFGKLMENDNKRKTRLGEKMAFVFHLLHLKFK